MKMFGHPKDNFLLKKARLNFEVCIWSGGENNLRGCEKIGPLFYNFQNDRSEEVQIFDSFGFEHNHVIFLRVIFFLVI